MAFLKEQQLSSKIFINYWKVAQLNMNYDRLDAVVVLAGYLNQEARNEGAEPVCSCQFDLSEHFHNEQGEGQLKNLNRAKAYEVIKQLAQAELEKDEEEQNKELAFFADAQDV